MLQPARCEGAADSASRRATSCVLLYQVIDQNILATAQGCVVMSASRSHLSNNESRRAETHPDIAAKGARVHRIPL